MKINKHFIFEPLFNINPLKNKTVLNVTFTTLNSSTELFSNLFCILRQSSALTYVKNTSKRSFSNIRNHG